jgi:AraC family transcriptional regulator
MKYNQKQSPTRLTDAKKFIDEFYFKKITVCELASIACKEKHHFVRCFKKEFGETPHKYVVRKRLEMAKVFISTSAGSISTISQRLGYNDISAFSNQYKKCFGCPPSKDAGHHEGVQFLNRQPFFN